MFEVKRAGWNPAGRSASWRLGMGWVGLVLAGLGVLIIVFPDIIAYAIGGMFVFVGLMLITSAVFARSPSKGEPGWTAQEEDVTVVVETKDD